MNAKIILISIFLLSLAINVSGQLTVDAGKDTTLCMCADTLQLGGNLTAVGGKEPYVYKWELLPVYYYDYRITASELLNDSTSANPIIDCNSILNDTVTLVLTVTDANFNSKTDSVKIMISTIAMTHLLYFRPTINQGDSVQIYPGNVDNGLAPFSYNWTPETGLSNPTIRNPYAKPSTSTRYTCTVTDAIGCYGIDYTDVVVIPTAISDIVNSKYSSLIAPNPITTNSQIQLINPLSEKLNIKVVNINGQVILDELFHSDYYDVGKKINQSGTYFYTIKKDMEILSTGKFIKL